MWAGVTDGMTAKIADDFKSSIHFDSRMYRQDITGSMAHAAMLASKGIISQADADKLIATTATATSNILLKFFIINYFLLNICYFFTNSITNIDTFFTINKFQFFNNNNLMN